jgi:hypothetical protein
MDKEIRLLREKVQDLSQENVALREINVQFQLENFKLQQKIKNLENSHHCDPNVSVITFNDGTFDATAEYLEEDHLEISHKNTKLKSTSKQRTPRPAAKRSYQDAFEDEFEEETAEDKLKIKQEIVIEDALLNEYIPDPQSDIEGLDSEEVNPKDAATIIYKIAAKKGHLDKLKSLEPGKQKDASFVNKTLDLFFSRVHLANSSARGQKCQTKPNVPVRPALDQKKMNLCRQAFIYRLKREGLAYSAREERLKNFFAYVNFKIQNSLSYSNCYYSRKCSLIPFIYRSQDVVQGCRKVRDE